MAIDVKVPSVGESVTEGRIARWLKKDGEAVKPDEPIFELESDKAAQEIAAPAAGVLKTLVPEGEIVKIGQVVATVDASAAPTEAKKAPPPTEPQKEPQPPSETSDGKPDVILSPAARVLVAEKNLDPKTITATGPGGRVTKSDVLAHPESSATKNGAITLPQTPFPKPQTPSPRETRQPMSMIRRRIAERLLESQNSTATLTTFNEVDMSAVMDLRSSYNERFEKKYGVKLGFMSMFVKAAVEALESVPNRERPHRRQRHRVASTSTTSASPSVPKKGLMVPVLRDADKLSFAEIEKKIADVAEACSRRQDQPSKT